MCYQPAARCCYMVHAVPCCHLSLSLRKKAFKRRIYAKKQSTRRFCISATNFWKPQLLTLEVGARGLVANRTNRAFTSLGFTASQANKLCKSLSGVAARCSYAIFLGHKHKTWIRSDLVDISVADSSSASRELGAQGGALQLFFSGCRGKRGC